MGFSGGTSPFPNNIIKSYFSTSHLYFISIYLASLKVCFVFVVHLCGPERYFEFGEGVESWTAMRLLYPVNDNVFSDVGKGETRLQGCWDAWGSIPLRSGIALGDHEDCLGRSVRHQ